jgi:capsule polysaccharide export protein KpsC/LpsZ
VKELTKKELENQKFVLFTLHKQPEASVDNTGRYFEDQLEVIKNIWRILPEDTLLIVKEHSNAIGDRKREFYNKINEYKNVEFVQYNEDSYSLINMCEAVFTISGTVAYEAALMGKPAFTFIPIFFNKLSLCRHISYDDLRDPKTSLSVLINSVQYSEDKDQEYTNWIHSNSFEGIISDYNSNPACMEDENVEKIVKAINVIVSI